MRDIRNAADLGGLWSAIPMPWKRDGTLDTGMLARNIERLAAVPCNGIYTTDSDGEFYAIELDEFRYFVAQLSKLTAAVDCGMQVGVTWTNTQGIIDRIKVCNDHGISTVHICYPYWMPLNADDVAHFWDDLTATVSSSRWIHYNTPRGHVRMTGADYARLAELYPHQFIGTKLSTRDYHELSDIIGTTPHLAHFVTDFVTVPGLLLGAKGVYSFWVNTLPKWQKCLMDQCAAGRWQAAAEMQRKFNCWEARYVQPLIACGYLHGILGKTRCSLSGFLEDGGTTRPPYSPIPASQRNELAAHFREWWSTELLREHVAAT